MSLRPRSPAAIPNRHIANLTHAVTYRADTAGDAILGLAESATIELREWLGFLATSRDTGIATDLLTGTRAALVECTACLCLGLLRPALYAMRATIDMTLAWLYFKDHPVEWQVVVTAGDGYKLPGEIIKYLNAYIPGFKTRTDLLARCGRRRIRDPYSFLSGYVHGQAPHTMGVTGELTAAVYSADSCKEAAAVLADVCTYLGEVLAAVHASQWSDLPTPIQEAYASRLTAGQLREFCE